MEHWKKTARVKEYPQRAYLRQRLHEHYLKTGKIEQAAALFRNYTQLGDPAKLHLNGQLAVFPGIFSYEWGPTVAYANLQMFRRCAFHLKAGTQDTAEGQETHPTGVVINFDSIPALGPCTGSQWMCGGGAEASRVRRVGSEPHGCSLSCCAAQCCSILVCALSWQALCRQCLIFSLLKKC